MINLSLGATGKLVAFFQSVLKSNGYYTGLIDGIFGPNTQKAVIGFQNALGLTPSGNITDEFVSKILKYISVPTDLEYTSQIVDIVIKSLLHKFSFLKYSSIRKKCA